MSESVIGEPLTKAAAPPARYTALFHVHGMGSQRRYEEISRVVDALDQLAHADESKYGIIESIKPALEKSRTEVPGEVGYIGLVRRQYNAANQGWHADFRFYEGYWAFVTAEGVPYRDVIRWLMRCLLAPIKALATPWRLRARLRRAALLKLWPRISIGLDVQKSDLKSLLDLYDEFEKWDARRSYKQGSRQDFLNYLSDRIKDDASRCTRLQTLTRRWQRNYLFGELRNLFLLATATLMILLGCAAGLSLTYVAMKGAAHFAAIALPVWANPDWLKPDWTNLSMFFLVLLAAAGVTGFLKDYLGDVQFWTTYEETSDKFKKRREILDVVGNALTHVLNDPACERVVVSSHSLGTTIAFDVLLELARKNRAAQPDARQPGPIALNKIRHLITFGSPIDKVHYFFESYSGKYHRYNRVVEDLRGDIGTAPFAFNAWPLIHWINFWDQADIVSAPLFSPANRSYPSVHVDNVEVSNVAFPDPAAAHTAYFENPRVVETLFGATFENQFSYPALTDKHKPPLDSLQLPDGRGRGLTIWYQSFAIATPWLILGLLLAWLADAPILGLLSGGIALIAFVLLLGSISEKTRARRSVASSLRSGGYKASFPEPKAPDWGR